MLMNELHRWPFSASSEHGTANAMWDEGHDTREQTPLREFIDESDAVSAPGNFYS